MKTTKKAIFLIILSSICAGIGQLMWKSASSSLTSSIFSFLNIYLIGGIFLYGLATVIMVLSFREGELSVLHPFLATSYVWVTLISPFIISSETLSTFKILGVILIFFGVSFIAYGGKKANAG